jgi:hypothetical protein
MNTVQKCRPPKKGSRLSGFTDYLKQNTTNKPWGTLEENGVGKFNDFTPKRCRKLRIGCNLYLVHRSSAPCFDTGLHCNWNLMIQKLSKVELVLLTPKDYNVNPDLAINPANRLQEFEALIARTHQEGLNSTIEAAHEKRTKTPTTLSR